MPKKERWWARRKRAFAHPTNCDESLSVIASVSEAIHRAASKEARVGCFVARAPRNDVDGWGRHDTETWVRILAARSARGLPLFWRTLENKGRAGIPGARCTRGLVCISSVLRTRAYRSTEITRHPRTQRLYGLSRALLGARALWPPSPAAASPPAWHQRRDAGTTRFFRTSQEALVTRTTLDVHHSPPRVDDVGQRPSWWGGMEGNIEWVSNSVNKNFYPETKNIFSDRA